MRRREFVRMLGPAGAMASGIALGGLGCAGKGSDDWATLASLDLKPIEPRQANVVARGARGIVSTSHPLATEAALWALRRGGSAADGYLTAALAQCVLEPVMTTLGGGFGLGYFDAAAGTLSQAGGGFAFPAALPADTPYDESKAYSGWGVMVPGYVRGLEAAHRAFCRLPWADLFEPAIAFARDGFVVDHQLWGITFSYVKLVGRYPGDGRDVWSSDGNLPAVGSRLHQPALAETLTRLRDEGPDYFYAGPFAERLAAAVQRRGGAITVDDLANLDAAPASEGWHPNDGAGSSTYRGFQVPPLAPVQQLMLNLLEVGDLRSMGRPTDEARTLYAQMRIAQEGWLHGTGYIPEDHQRFVSAEFAREVWATIEAGPPRPFTGFAASTCGLAIVDADGNVASGTHSSSSSPYGSGIVVDGVILNRAIYLRKYRNMPRGISTAIWLFREGRPAFVMATPSRSFNECILQVTANVIEFEMGPAAAVRAPRFGHPHPGITAAEIEGDFPEPVLAAVAERGMGLFPVTPFDMNMGSAHAILLAPDGGVTAIADPRRRGLAKAVD